MSPATVKNVYVQTFVHATRFGSTSAVTVSVLPTPNVLELCTNGLPHYLLLDILNSKTKQLVPKWIQIQSNKKEYIHKILFQSVFMLAPL